MSGYATGFYGVRNCLWFIGCKAHATLFNACCAMEVLWFGWVIGLL